MATRLCRAGSDLRTRLCEQSTPQLTQTSTAATNRQLALENSCARRAQAQHLWIRIRQRPLLVLTRIDDRPPRGFRRKGRSPVRLTGGTCRVM